MSLLSSKIFSIWTEVAALSETAVQHSESKMRVSISASLRCTAGITLDYAKPGMFRYVSAQLAVH